MKASILFVDDEVNLIQGLRRALRSFSPEWEQYFALTGQEALQILEQNQIDMMVTDMRMPGMDGAELLEIVNKKYPSVVRLVLSGHSDQEMALKATRTAHQFIPKPVEAEKLHQIIDRALRQKSLLADPRMAKIITGISKLPSLPSLYLRLVKEIESPDASPKMIGGIIAQDITMTAKILQLVNSGFYSFSTKIVSPELAVNILGLNTIKGLVLVEQVFSQFKGTPSRFLEIDRLWKHSLEVGNLARQIARSKSGDARISDDAQVAGLLHDIGKLIMLRIPGFCEDHYQSLLNGAPPINAEYDLVGTSHAELGAYLLGIWGLPDTIVEGVAYHHRPSNQPDRHFTALTAVYLANYFISQRNRTARGDPSLPLDETYLQEIHFLGDLEDLQLMAMNSELKPEV